MRIRFRSTTVVPGGPQYRPGDVIETDKWQLTPARAQDYVARGWAEAVAEPVPAKSVTAPPMDKQITTPPAQKRPARWR